MGNESAMLPLINHFRAQSCALQIMFNHISTKDLPIGVEQLVSFDASHGFKSIHHYASKVIYHACNFMAAQSTFEEKIASMHGLKPGSATAVGHLTAPMSYEFDSFVAALGTFVEEPTKLRFQELMTKSGRKAVEAIWPNKSDELSLFWRVNLIRNRIVHPDYPTFIMDNARVMDHNSSVDMCRVTDDGYQLECNLIDPVVNHEALRIIKDVLIPRSQSIKDRYKKERKEGMHSDVCRPQLPDFIGTAFPGKKSKGKPQALMWSPGISLPATFDSLCRQGIGFIQQCYKIAYKDIARSECNGWSFAIRRDGSIDHWCTGEPQEQPEDHIEYCHVQKLFA